MQELETAINAVELHCNDTDQCLSSPSYSLELQTLILSLHEEAGDVYYRAHVYAYLYSALTESTIQSWITNMFLARHPVEHDDDFSKNWLTCRRNVYECCENGPEPIQRLKACSRGIIQIAPDSFTRVTTINTDKQTILHGDRVIRNGSMTHQDVHNLKTRALNRPNVLIYLGLKGWVVDGQLIDDTDYSELMQMLIPLVLVPNTGFPICFWVSLINSSPRPTDRAYFRDHMRHTNRSRLLEATKDRDECASNTSFLTATPYQDRAECFSDMVLNIIN